MRVPPKSYGLAYRSLNTQHGRIAFRKFHCSQIHLKKSYTMAGSFKKTITTKKFSELPASRVLPDGGTASPLGGWSGGLDGMQDGVRSIKSIVDGDIAIEPPEGHKRRTRRTSVRMGKSTRNSELVIEEFPTTCTIKVRRGLRDKGGNLSNQPRNQLAIEILDNLAKFPHCILLTRVGQFYESYFSQAVEVSRLLNIKLTQRTWDGHRVLMCGFPLPHLDKYLKVLVQQNHKFVAMCEEFPRHPGASGFERRVVRVITPGTLIDEPFLNQYENNYLLAISLPPDFPRDSSLDKPPGMLGLAWMDVSTGEFFVKESSFERIRDDLARIRPREIVLDSAIKTDPSHPINRVLAEESYFVSFITPCTTDTLSNSTSVFADIDDLTSCDATPSARASFALHETCAIAILTSFLHQNLLEHMPHISAPSKEGVVGRMQIDAHTIKALEIHESIREGGSAGSLLSVIKRTLTSSGTRLLARWLCSPSTSIIEINTRQSLVAFFHRRLHLRDDLAQIIATSEDVTRIVQKFLLGRGDTNDLLAISRTIAIWSSLQRRIEIEKKMEKMEQGRERERGTSAADGWVSIDVLMSKMAGISRLAEKISMALYRNDITERANDGVVSTDNDIVQEELLSMKSEYKWTIKPEFSKRLTSLHLTLRDHLSRREELQRELQRVFDAPSLTLRSSPSYGMHVHLARVKRDQNKLQLCSDFVKLAESATTGSFFHRGWSQLGGQILETSQALVVAEKEAFETLRDDVNTFSSQLRLNARIVDELDVSLAFATLATEMCFVRPQITDDLEYVVENGRHPTVELGLLKAGRLFTPNSISFGPDSLLHVITGPNMAGKSTFLRQIALIAILAQIGSFVPAESTAIGIIDKLFSRIGANDDLYRDKSTFMVEMLETSDILRKATPKSLVIMDEVGRGTTMNDGLAIAFATVHHLVSVNRCRTLFATHFHELTDMLGHSADHKGQGLFSSVAFFCTGIDKTEDGRFAYSHRLRPGVSGDSHGLKVARLAGMPASALTVAQGALDWLKAKRDEDEVLGLELRTLGRVLAAPTTPAPPLL